MKNKYEEWEKHQLLLKESHEKIAKKLSGKTIAYIDIPVHFNVGDLLIYHGTEAFLKNNGLNVIYRSDIFNLDKKCLDKVDLILFHGGGNFGDLYPKIHNKRIGIIDKYKHKEIIVLPQSVHFNSLSNRDETEKVLKSHPNLTMYVRDEDSFFWLKDLSVNVDMMPDMAHSLYPIHSENTVKRSYNKNLVLRRVDIESKIGADNLEKDIVTFDWFELITKLDKLNAKLYRLLSRTPISQNFLARYWYFASKIIINRAIDYFNKYQQVDTDRLHGLIFSNLLYKEVIVRDNSYGKNSKYYLAWLKGTSNIKMK